LSPGFIRASAVSTADAFFLFQAKFEGGTSAAVQGRRAMSKDAWRHRQAVTTEGSLRPGRGCDRGEVATGERLRPGRGCDRGKLATEG